MKFLKIMNCHIGSGKDIEIVNMTRKEVKESILSRRSCNRKYPGHKVTQEYYELKRVTAVK